MLILLMGMVEVQSGTKASLFIYFVMMAEDTSNSEHKRLLVPTTPSELSTQKRHQLVGGRDTNC